MKLAKTDFYAKKERKFFKKHSELIDKYGAILETLQTNPFDALSWEMPTSNKASITIKKQKRLINSIS